MENTIRIIPEQKAEMHLFGDTPQGSFVKADSSDGVWLRANTAWVCITDGLIGGTGYIRGSIVTHFEVKASNHVAP